MNSMITTLRRSALAVWESKPTSALKVCYGWLQTNIPRSITPGQQKGISRLLVVTSLLVPVLLHEKQISLIGILGWVLFLVCKEFYEFALAGNRDARWTDAERLRAGAIAGAINEVGELLRHKDGRTAQPISKPVVLSNLLRALEDDVRRLTGKAGSVSMIMSLLEPVAGSDGAGPEHLNTVAISQNLGQHQFKIIRIDSCHPPAVAFRENHPVVAPIVRTYGCNIEKLRGHPYYRSMVAFPITFSGSSGEVIAVVVIIAEEEGVFTEEVVDRRFEEVIRPYLRLLAVLQTIA